MKLGIMGGTFDPVHFGHLSAAEAVKRSLDLSKVLFIPTGNPAHKKNKRVTEALLRYKMLEAALYDHPGFEISDVEIKRPGSTYAVDTLRELKKIFPKETRLFYIIGADVVAELDSWKEYEEDFKMCSFAAVLRPGYHKEKFLKDVEKMKALGADIFPVETAQVDISSSEIRKRVKEGLGIEKYVPKAVEKFIVKEDLYKD